MINLNADQARHVELVTVDLTPVTLEAINDGPTLARYLNEGKVALGNQIISLGMVPVGAPHLIVSMGASVISPIRLTRTQRILMQGGQW